MPQRGVDVLHEVATQLGIGFVVAREPFDRRREALCRGGVLPILARRWRHASLLTGEVVGGRLELFQENIARSRPAAHLPSCKAPWQ